MDEIQEFYIDHAQALAVLNKQLIEDEGHSNPMSVRELAARMGKWLQNGYFCYGIARNGRPVAYALYRDDGDYFYLRQLFTARDHRNQGLASKLLEHLKTTVFAKKTVRLEVLSGNKRALKFYQKHGFEVYCHTLVNRV